MKILIIYATYSGSTQMAAQTVNDILLTHSHTVVMRLVSEVTPDEMTAYDLIIFASPSWDDHGKDGQPHEDFLTFHKKYDNEVFTNKKFAVLGLGDKTYAHFCGAVDVIEGWVTDMKGVLAIPSLRIDSFYFDTEGNVAKIKEWATNLAKSLSSP